MDELKFYTYPSCTSCRRTKAWLKNQGVEFNEQHLFRETPSVNELKKILSLTTHGIDEILAKRSREYKTLEVDVENLSLSEFLDLVIDKPKLLRRPILTNGKSIVIGYDPDGLKKITDYRMESLGNIS
ncbi:Spx/MgsR family RNA polymerase-binding regulatory protein [Halobacillus litoralis]|uniref:Transcriptional regulator n=1 Tax=Halobacillus litoralis TaxID=45668 RepID=A0A410MHM0_9BACI|nr:Spx/MgsR family RNA polymerase-binding regulatory protein [Halobacillus litoralis]QAS54201.1 transcriptional regulator [Halobacillus litoralis]